MRLQPPDLGDPAIASALDRFDVPGPSAGFLERIARVPHAAGLAPLPIPPRHRLRNRGPWMRRTTTGIVALGMASVTAAAAATGMFETIGVRLPTIAALLAPAPASVAAHKPPVATRKKPAQVAKIAAPTPEPEAIAAPLPSPPYPDARARLQRFLQLPPPMRAAIRERQITRVQLQLADRGIFLPRPEIRRRLIRRAMRQLADPSPLAAAAPFADPVPMNRDPLALERGREWLMELRARVGEARFEEMRQAFLARRAWRMARQAGRKEGAMGAEASPGARPETFDDPAQAGPLAVSPQDRGAAPPAADRGVAAAPMPSADPVPDAPASPHPDDQQ